MKKLLIVVLAAFTLFSCQKKDTPSISATQDVEFGVIEVDPGLKSTDDFICQNLTPHYAQIKIKDAASVETYYYPQVFRLAGKLYTQAIKLAPGNYHVTEFLLLHDPDGDGVEDPYNPASLKDTVLMATPTSASPYAAYVNQTTDVPFTVGEFTKTEVDIEVLCFMNVDYAKFGFNWFAITEIIIREYCFFGDFCVKHPSDYLNSWYGTFQPPTGQTAIDMAAIFKVHVYDVTGGAPVQVHNSPFTNATAAANYGVGSPLCVQFPDNLNIPNEKFRFELWIYVAVGSGWDYVKFHEWEVTDDGTGMITDVDGDKVVEFVLGNCNFSDTDLQLAPYQNLPTSVNMTITYAGADPGYWDFYVNTVAPSGNYDFGVGPQVGWCGDHVATIGSSSGSRTYDFFVFSSLYPETWPTNPTWLTPEKINQVNWLFNHLGDWGLDMATLVKADGLDLQNAIWKILQNHGTGNKYSLAAIKVANESFVPLPGGWAAVLLYTQNEDGVYVHQLLFVQVDP